MVLKWTVLGTGTKTKEIDMEILLSGIAGLALGFGLTYAYQYKKLKDMTEQFVDKSVVVKMLRDELRKASPKQRRYYKNKNGKKKTSGQNNG